MTVTDIVNSNLSTQLLEAMCKSTEAQIKTMQMIGLEPKELIGWKNKFSAAISIRCGIESKNHDCHISPDDGCRYHFI